MAIFFPSWLRAGGILVFASITYGVFALIFHSAAIHLPGNPLVIFCLLGGAESLVEHLWGIYAFKILEIPLLQKASPVSILAFSFPEYIFYWCIVISIAAVARKAHKSFTSNQTVF